MIALLIIPCWIALLVLVAALCAAARLGDRQAGGHPESACGDASEPLAGASRARRRRAGRRKARATPLGARGAAG